MAPAAVGRIVSLALTQSYENQLRARWQPQNCVHRSPPAMLVVGVVLLCFWIPVMKSLELCSRVEGRGVVSALPPLLPRV